MTLDERLDRLERDLERARRRFRWSAIVTGVAVVGLAAWLLAGPKGYAATEKMRGTLEEVRTRRLVIEDEAGKVRAGLYVTKDGAALGLYDEAGKGRALMGVAKDGAALGLFDEAGRGRAGIEVTNDGAALALCDEAGRDRARMNVTKDGAGLHLADGKGTGRLALGASAMKTPAGKTIRLPESTITLFGPDGKVVWQVPRD